MRMKATIYTSNNKSHAYQNNKSLKRFSIQTIIYFTQNNNTFSIGVFKNFMLLKSYFLSIYPLKYFYNILNKRNKKLFILSYWGLEGIKVKCLNNICQWKDNESKLDSS